MGFDLFVHHRVGEHGLVALVVTKAAVAEDVDHDVFVELLAELCCHLRCVYNRFWVVTVDVENRSLNHKRVVGWVWRRPREVRRSGETDLVVHHDVHCAARFVTA